MNRFAQARYKTSQIRSRLFISQLVLQSNTDLVLTSIKATTDGSCDEVKCSAGERRDELNCCQSCPENTYGTDGLTCPNCPPNSTSHARSNKLTRCRCLKDHYLDHEGSKECVRCPSTSTSAPGSSALAHCKCPKDTYLDRQNEVCKACPPGATSPDVKNSELTHCKCSENHYMNLIDEVCETCPTGATSNKGSTKLEHCTCPAGYYMNLKGNCQNCPHRRDPTTEPISEEDCSDFHIGEFCCNLS